MTTLSQTNFQFPSQLDVYHGKVRDVYFMQDNLVVIATDRISAFDHILPKPIPYKGQVLNLIAAHFLTACKDICPNWLEATPHPNVSIGLRCEPIRIEMVIRGYLAGHSAREYAAGKRILCGVALPTGMKENDRFLTPIITPAVKNLDGHDEDASREDILSKGIISLGVYAEMEMYTYKLFERGTLMAAQQGLILVDTKYEFGLHDGKVYLIDEIHTPDSSRYFLAEGYEEKQLKGLPQEQLSKEFVREWLIANQFQGKDGQHMPNMPNSFVEEISNRYIALYEQLTGTVFQRNVSDTLESDIHEAVIKYFSRK